MIKLASKLNPCPKCGGTPIICLKYEWDDVVDWCGLAEEEIDKIIDEFNSIGQYSFPIEPILFYYAYTERTNEIDRRDVEAIMSAPGFDGEEIK